MPSVLYTDFICVVQYLYMQQTKTGIKPWMIIIGVLIILAIWVGSSYNRMITLRQQTRTSWAQIDTQLQRRYDLIPNLTSTVKGLTKQEQTIFGDLAKARASYSGAQGNPTAQATAANNVESAISRLLVIVENYPVLRSSEAFTGLMAELAGSENRVAVARKDYNEAVSGYETTRQRFPGSVIAGMFNFETIPYFQISSEEVKEVPKVDFE